MKLYEISNQYKEVFNNYFMSEEMTLGDVDKLRDLEGKFEDKCIAIASFIKNLQAEESAIDNAIIEMKKRGGSLKTKIDSLTNYLKHHMESMNTQEIKKSPYFKISIKKNPWSLQIISEDFIPREYHEIIPASVSIDRAKLKEALKTGIEIGGAMLVQNTRLEIK